MKPVIVTSYVHPDLDGIACIIAYAEYLQKTGTDAIAAIIAEPQVEANYLLRRIDVPCPDHLPATDRYDRVVLVDASDPNDLDGAIAPEKIVEIIDHRMINDADAFPNAQVQIELVGAVATLIAEKFMHGTVEPSEQTAVLLCGGIISNTLNFKGGVTTDRDRTAFAWLNRIAKLPEGFWRELFIAKSDLSGGGLAERMKGDFKWFILGGKRVGIAEIEMIGAEALVHGRSDEIRAILEGIKQERRLDIIFLNTVELEEERTFLVAPDADAQRLLLNAVHADFTGIIAELPYLLMRKQIVPFLKQTLER